MNPPADRTAPRLNPFAFPAETTFRFVLLVVMVLSTSAFIYDSIFFTVNAQAALETLNHCFEEVGAAYSPESPEYSTALSQCRAPMARRQAAWVFVGLASLLVVAAGLYWFLPTWKIWRNRLKPLKAEDAPEMMTWLVALCRESGLAHPPVFLLNPLNGAGSGLAFGRLGRYYIVLSGGLVTQFYKDRAAFRAVVLHEIAHLRNADVNKTYFSVAIWRAFVAVALLPYAVTLFFPPPGIAAASISWVFTIGIRLLTLAALVFATYNAVLRAREIYADLRAAAYEGGTGSLARVLGELRRPHGRSWYWFFQAHPDPEERLQVLADPSPLFRTSFWEAFGTGVAAAIATANLFALLTTLTTGVGEVLWGLTSGQAVSLGTALLVMPLVGGVTGLGLAREGYAALVRGGQPGGVLRLTLGLGAGAVIGLSFSPVSALEMGAGLSLSLIAFNLLALFVLLVFLSLLLHWVGMAASAWLRVALDQRSALPVNLAIVGITSGLLSVLIGQMYLLYYLGVYAAGLGEFFGAVLFVGLQVFIDSTSDPLTLLSWIALWVFPLASLFWRKKPVSPPAGASWAFLDGPQGGAPLPARGGNQIGLALLVGLVGGLMWCGLMFVVDVVLRIGVPEFTAADAQRVNAFLPIHYALAALAQALLACVSAVLVRQLRAAHGLFSAFVAGCVMAFGLAAIVLILSGGVVSATFVWQIFANVVGIGAFVAFPAVMIVTALIDWLRPAALPRPQPLSR